MNFDHLEAAFAMCRQLNRDPQRDWDRYSESSLSEDEEQQEWDVWSQPSVSVDENGMNYVDRLLALDRQFPRLSADEINDQNSDRDTLDEETRLSLIHI